MATDRQYSEKPDQSWVAAYINTSLATPAGYRLPAVATKPRQIDNSAAPAQDVADGGVSHHVLLGRGELSELRHALVVLNDSTWYRPLDAAVAVARLSCAGATVVTGQLVPSVRELLPVDLVRLCDVLNVATNVAPDQHEDLSISVRRSAHRSFGYNPSGDQHLPSVAVFIDPTSHSAARLETEFARQENVKVSIVRAKDWTEGFGRPSEPADDALYVADTRPDVTYGPHHLEDLIQALRHSGADLAFSPDRFEHQPDQGVLLEDVAGPSETLLPIRAGSPYQGNSLRYRSAGSAEPRLSYAVHGCQSIVLPVGANPIGRRTHGRVRRTRPPQLAWADDVLVDGAEPAPSYISRAAVAARN